MTDTPRYDPNAGYYVAFVDRALADRNSFWQPMLAWYAGVLHDRLPGARVCDVACGEGYLSRFLGRLGPREVVGLDLSAALIGAAKERSDQPHLSFRVDDAQVLGTLEDASVDIAVSQLALMDIPDHRAMFRAVRRVLTAGGMFVFSLLHPCFEAPFHEPDAPQFLTDPEGMPTAYTLRQYAREGAWQSGGVGVRGRVGAYHRTLSTLINDLLAAGFVLEQLHEPTVRAPGLFAQVPRALMVSARAG